MERNVRNPVLVVLTKRWNTYIDSYDFPPKLNNQTVMEKEEEVKVLIISNELWHLLSYVIILEITEEIELDYSGIEKRTSSGNPVFKKARRHLSEFVDLGSANVLYNKVSGETIPSYKGTNISAETFGLKYTIKSHHRFFVNNLDKPVMTTKLGKLFKGIADAVGEQIDVNKLQVLEAISEAIKANFLKEDDFEIKILDNPSALYGEKYFSGNDLGSCMSVHHKDNYEHAEYVTVYDDIKECKGVLITKDGEDLGRCLLWEDKYYDVAYAKTYSEKRAIYALMELKNYTDASLPHISYRLEDDYDGYEFPYMDTFDSLYYDSSEGILYLANYNMDEDNDNMESIGDLRTLGDSNVVYTCRCCGDDIGEYDYLSTEDGEYLCCDCGAIPEDSEYAYEINDLTGLTHGRGVGEFMLRDYVELDSSIYGRCSYANDDDAIHCHDGDYCLGDDVIEITAGESEGDYAHDDHLASHNGEMVLREYLDDYIEYLEEETEDDS